MIVARRYIVDIYIFWYHIIIYNNIFIEWETTRGKRAWRC